MGNKLEWDEFPGRGRYLSIYLETGVKEKNVAKLINAIDYYEAKGYKLHSVNTTETAKTISHFMVFEKA